MAVEVSLCSIDHDYEVRRLTHIVGDMLKGDDGRPSRFLDYMIRKEFKIGLHDARQGDCYRCHADGLTKRRILTMFLYNLDVVGYPLGRYQK